MKRDGAHTGASAYTVSNRIPSLGKEAIAEHAVAVDGGGGRVTVGAVRPARFVILSGAETREPVLVHGPFIMTRRSEIEAADARHRAGQMGHL